MRFPKMTCKTCGKKNCGILIGGECDKCHTEEPWTLLREIDWLQRQEKDVDKKIKQLERKLRNQLGRKLTPIDNLMYLFGQRVILEGTLEGLSESIGFKRGKK